MGACAADTEARAVSKFRNFRMVRENSSDVYGEWRATEISEAAPEKNLEPAIAAKDAEIARLREEIAQLCGYDNVQEMDSEASRSALAGGGGA